jgi:hypothetical protein
MKVFMSDSALDMPCVVTSKSLELDCFTSLGSHNR